MRGLVFWRDWSLREKRLLIVSSVLVLFCLSLLLYTLHMKQESDEKADGLLPLDGGGSPVQTTAIASVPPEAAGTAYAAGKPAGPEKIAVDVKGAVKHPGVYEIAASDRVIDVIQLCGGLLENADVTKVNLAAHLTDGSVLYIPAAGEESPTVFAQPAAGEAQPADGRIDINAASAEQLDSLPGIGPSKAQAIIDYRNQNGPFHRIEDLLNVKGIGAKTLEQFRDRVVVR